ncbi:other/ULK/ULK protein kinase [Lentinula aff. detonsa]|uniref:non-specific serine/threonine protein kinase n=1 Tax=Lentinula aff. detonsa TaxID=2804958 RepID=A0AA38NNY0_9AGAR|nr:other/ULK/ULK protein kinase [Lentinula aff. detonsa]
MNTAMPARTNSSLEGSNDDEVRPYVISSEIGRGSFAIVYKGYHEETHKQVAIKTVKRDKLSAKLFENLQSEIQILKLLSHRHITRLIDIVQSQHNIYLVMEYCSGGDLTHYIKKRGRVETLEYIPSPGAAPQYYPHPRTGGLDEIVVRSFLRQLARALKLLRHRNLIHRDIKPQNLLLSPAPPEEIARGHPLGVPILKVADFGFARSLPKTMMAETLCGSPLYMAPEILGYKKHDEKADLWSVGAVLYEMSVGKPPFRAQNHIELLKKIEHSKGIKFPDEDPTSSAAKSGGGGSEALPVPSDIKKLIRMLLKQRPLERASFDQFFGSTAIAKSKFPRPKEDGDVDISQVGSTMSGTTSIEQIRNGPDEEQTATWSGRPVTPEAHKVIPPEVLDEKAMIPPSKFNFRRTSTVGEPGSTPPLNDPLIPKERYSQPQLKSRQSSASSNLSARPRMPSSRPLSIESSVIPGETDEDGLLRREYVLVGDTRAVEFNRAVDELDSVPRRPLQEPRIPPSPSIEVYPSPANNQAQNLTFPPPPSTSSAPPLSSSPSSVASRAASHALNRALSLASKKLFGTTQNQHHRKTSSSQSNSRPPSSPSSSSPRRLQILPLAVEERDPLEDELLRVLEELAQKTEVLTHWADEMYEYVKAVPQKPLPDPTKFIKREGEADKSARKRKHADMEAEYNAVTCVAVYMLLMSFSQKGIDKLRNYQEHMNMRYPDGDFVVSDGFDDALSWFKDHFIKCNDRAALVKTWLPAQYDGPKSWLDQLVYDRALLLSRTAARKELLDQATTPDECEKLYEESLWCLYALQDDLLQTGNPFMEEDQTTIGTWIKRTKLRLFRCRARMAMNDRDRLKDARADQNLADVARIPAPWDVKPSGKVDSAS